MNYILSLSSEDWEYINTLADSGVYHKRAELLIAAIDADTTAAELLLSDFQ